MSDTVQQQKAKWFPKGLEFSLAMHIPSTARMIVIAMFVKGDDRLRKRMLRVLRPDYFPRCLEQRLLSVSFQHYQRNGNIEPEWLRDQIAALAQSEVVLTGYYRIWEQIMSIESTEWETNQALSLLLWIAQREEKLRKEDQTEEQERLIASLSPLPARGDSQDEIPEIDLDTELFEHQRVIVSDLVVLSAFLHGSDAQRDEILQSISKSYFSFPFGAILYGAMTREYEEQGDIDVNSVIQHASELIDTDKMRASVLANLNLARSWSPSERQIRQAIHLMRRAALRKGVLESSGSNMHGQ